MNYSLEENRVKLEYSKFGLIEIKNSAVDQSLEIVRRRIDEIGTNDPTIIRRGNDRILVELPGLSDPNRIKKLLGKTANLTFRLVSESEDDFGSELLSFENRESKLSISKRVILSGNNLMNLIVTRTFPPTIGGMQNLMWGLANAVSKIDLLKVYADYELNHDSFDEKVSFSIERIKGFKLFQKYRKAYLINEYLKSNKNINPEMKEYRDFFYIFLIFSLDIFEPTNGSPNNKIDFQPFSQFISAEKAP